MFYCNNSIWFLSCYWVVLTKSREMWESSRGMKWLSSFYWDSTTIITNSSWHISLCLRAFLFLGFLFFLTEENRSGLAFLVCSLIWIKQITFGLLIYLLLLPLVRKKKVNLTKKDRIPLKYTVFWSPHIYSSLKTMSSFFSNLLEHSNSSF